MTDYIALYLIVLCELGTMIYLAGFAVLPVACSLSPINVFFCRVDEAVECEKKQCTCRTFIYKYRPKYCQTVKISTQVFVVDI